jgi:hypothetical protein
MKKFIFPILAIVLIGIVTGIFYWRDRSQSSDISSYEVCATAGYPTQESNPPRCLGPNGQSFVGKTGTGELPITPRQTEYFSEKGVKIVITEPDLRNPITSPLTVLGEAPGNWSFEASFPISLLGPSGDSLVQLPAHLKGDWMTESYVPFEAVLDFTPPESTAKGTLLLRKDNPSGLPENDDQLEIPVTLK